MALACCFSKAQQSSIHWGKRLNSRATYQWSSKAHQPVPSSIVSSWIRFWLKLVCPSVMWAFDFQKQSWWTVVCFCLVCLPRLAQVYCSPCSVHPKQDSAYDVLKVSTTIWSYGQLQSCSLVLREEDIRYVETVICQHGLMPALKLTNPARLRGEARKRRRTRLRLACFAKSSSYAYELPASRWLSRAQMPMFWVWLVEATNYCPD